MAANYTLSKCTGHPTQGGTTPNVNSGYVDPNNIDYDYGACDSDRRHLFNLTASAETPRFDNDVRASGGIGLAPLGDFPRLFRVAAVSDRDG